MPHFILPSGSRDAKIVVVGRDCGWEEMRDGRGFVGASGKLIWHPTRGTGAADLAGLPRESCLVTNVVNTKPLANDWSKHESGDVARGMEELQSLLAASPRVLVVALGEHASLACAGIIPSLDSTAVSAQFALRFGDSITNVRGYVYDTGDFPLLVVCHPAFLLRNWHPWWATFCWDWQKAARIARQGGWTAPQTAWRLITKVEEGNCFGYTPPECVAIDIETSGVGCVAFAWSDKHAMVFPGKPIYNHPHEVAIRDLLESTVPKVFQNGQFDVTMMERVGWRVNNWRYDTMLMWHALEPMLAGTQKDDSVAGRKKKGGKRTEKGLRFLASLLTDRPFWKSYEFERDEDQFALCAEDAMATWEIWRNLRARLAAD